MNCIGIMQGRLLPPVGDRIQAFPKDRWRDEFPFAAAAGLSTIEWIYERYGQDVNPLMQATGRDELRHLMHAHGVAVRSVCADYFMDEPLIRCSPAELDARVAHLAQLVDACADLAIDRIVVPFVDRSAIHTDDEATALVEVLSGASRIASAAGVELHLETALDPAAFAAVLARLPHAVMVNYDSGNSAALGFAPRDEFAAYGERVGSVHIKDRVRGGGTVPLGAGAVDWVELFGGLDQIGYDRDFTLQVARGEAGDEVNWARRNLAFVTERWR